MRETDKTNTTTGGPNPGLLRPPIIFLGSILLGITLNLVWPLHFMPSSVRLVGPVVTCLRRSALPAFLPGISGRRHFRTRKHAFHYDCAERSLPIQSQSHLSGVHPVRARIVRLAEQSLAARNARSRCRCHRDDCDPARRTVS